MNTEEAKPDSETTNESLTQVVQVSSTENNTKSESDQCGQGDSRNENNGISTVEPDSENNATTIEDGNNETIVSESCTTINLDATTTEDQNDDSDSDVSSVVNNASVISQTPDRYGFLGGDQYTHESEPDPPPEVIRRRELKWLSMLSRWESYMQKDFKKVRSRCRKGIPRSVRGRAWYYLCGGYVLQKRNPNAFSDLLIQEAKAQCVEDIRKDIHRQFPYHEIFTEEGHGQQDLFNVLKAFSIFNGEDGYCQAHAPIAATLLMHMPAEDAFWCLVAICDKYLKDYYSPGMVALQLDGDILFGLLKRVSYPAYKHLKKQKIEPVLYMTEWFLCAFTRTLPWSSVLRVWDMFLCEGVKVLFRVGLVLLKYTLGRPDVLKKCPTMFETLPVLKNLPHYVTHEQFLVVQICKLDITEDQMRREHEKQLKKRKKAEAKKLKGKNKKSRSTKSKPSEPLTRIEEGVDLESTQVQTNGTSNGNGIGNCNDTSRQEENEGSTELLQTSL